MQPWAIIFNTTDSCSLKCKYCFTNPNPRETTLQVAKDAMKYAAKNWIDKGADVTAPPAFTFFGGEPTLRWDEIIIPATKWCREVLDKELLEYEMRMQISITTNGQHLTRERLIQWKEIGNSILLSADGCQLVQEHDRPREDGASSFEGLDKIIPDLLEFFPQTTFRSTVTPFSVHYLLDSFIYAYSKGFKSYFVCPNVREHWDDEAREVLSKHIEAICNIQYCDMEMGATGMKFWNWFDHFYNVFNNEQKIEMSTRRCGLGTTSAGIGTKGEIFGCQEHNTYDETDIFYLGNIYTGGIEQKRIDSLLEKYSSLPAPVNALDPKKCDDCNFKNFCARSFCPSACLEVTGELNVLPDIECFWKNLLLENAKRILTLVEEDNANTALDAIVAHMQEKYGFGEKGVD